MQSPSSSSRSRRAPRVAALALSISAWGCQRASTPPGAPASSTVVAAAAQSTLPPTQAPEPVPEPTLEPAPEPTPLPVGIAPLVEPFRGDLDGMVARRVIRVLTVQSPVLYFAGRNREVGLTYDMVKALEKQFNQNLGNNVVAVHVIAIPVARDELIPRLLSGEGDIAAAVLTVTRERKKLVDFSAPLATGVREVLVTGPSAPPLRAWTSSAKRSSTSGSRAPMPSTCGPSIDASRTSASHRSRSTPPRKSWRTATYWRW
jgi:ABC-type amino acid transport substrate-binding protein